MTPPAEVDPPSGRAGRSARASRASRASRAGGAGRAPKHAPRVPFALLVTAMIVGGMALLLALNTASAANELRGRQYGGADASIAAQVESLRSQVAASSAPGNIAAAAAQLGMVPAGNPAFLVLGPSGSVQVLGSAAPVTGNPLDLPTAKKKPKKVPTPTKSATTTKSASSTKSASAGAAKSTATAKAAKTAKRTAAHPTSTPRPTPTPTPVLTLPGGPR